MRHYDWLDEDTKEGTPICCEAKIVDKNGIEINRNSEVEVIIFKEWLKEQGALEEYEKYFVTDNFDEDTFYDPCAFLGQAFDWALSKSGHNYWEDLNEKWHDYIDNGNLNNVYFSVEYVPIELDIPEETKPTHYNIGIDTFERMRANASLEEAMGFIRWNIDKYNTRKKGQDISDYKKIKDYCDEAIWWLENKGE